MIFASLQEGHCAFSLITDHHYHDNYHYDHNDNYHWMVVMTSMTMMIIKICHDNHHYDDFNDHNDDDDDQYLSRSISDTEEKEREASRVSLAASLASERRARNR